jgi:HEAT repeat protein
MRRRGRAGRYARAALRGAATALALGFALSADGAPAAPAQEPLSELLSGIEFVPDRSALDGVMGDAAPLELIGIARGRDADLNQAGHRIRAYRALALYPSEDIESVLRTAVAEHGAVATGVDTVYVRAAMDSLALVAPDTAISSLAPMLAHPSQDVRAGAARALGATGSSSVVGVLRERLAEEPVLHVRLAIADALRRVGQASGGTMKAP